MTPSEIKDIVNKFDWEKRWMERFSWFTPSLVGYVYNVGCKDELGVNLEHNFFVYNDGLVTCYQSISENTIFGNFLARELEANPALLPVWCADVRSKLKHALELTKLLGDKILTKEHFLEFKNAFAGMQPTFVRLTRVGTYLKDEHKDKFLPTLNALRLETETIYGSIDELYRTALKIFAEKLQRDEKLLQGLFVEDLENFFANSELPIDKILGERVPKSGMYFDSVNTHGVFCSEDKVRLFEQLIVEKNAPKDGVLRGVCAMKGAATGKVRIVLDPKKAGDFQVGDILVTSMTYPEFVPIMKKAGAIVTDGGGVLCHAAIVSRELGIPCVINTQVATALLKDGDMVEVNATSGVIKKL